MRHSGRRARRTAKVDGYGEAGAANARAEFDMTGMAFGDARDDRKPQSGAIDPRSVEPVEAPAQIGQPFRRDAGASNGTSRSGPRASSSGARRSTRTPPGWKAHMAASHNATGAKISAKPPTRAWASARAHSDRTDSRWPTMARSSPPSLVSADK